MARAEKSELAQHTAALKAHTAALKSNTKALNDFRAVLPVGLNTMNAGDVYHTGPCIDGHREVWISDGEGGLNKVIKVC